ncbi:Adenine deaminase [Caloramator quimbayensis]|uniref:Adenine deaminase n=1 Tax=Caloramator quimbayensis TaxID=1147123 RepID=A0A1T4Y7E7_9CLOT|nr:adenine deaminase [Caloramator quimbayensis]SKA97764.1 Adenine deaminase [Caloramator quimbayensis]
MNITKKNIDKSLSKEKAEIVLKNAFVIDVFNQDIFKADVAIDDGKIIGLGKYEGNYEIDCEGKYISPGFIDSHVHIESSKVIPKVFAAELLKRGVTTCIADPHEIANVLGIDGINFMIENSKDAVIDIFFMIPSCVPATDFEDSGAVLTSEDIKIFKDNPKVLGLGEVMDVPSVINCKEDMIRKINIFKDKVIDGHCPMAEEKTLNAYILSGVVTDHECSNAGEAIEKVRKGMYVMIREGSAAKNLDDIIAAVNDKNFTRFLFCTDDKSIIDIVNEGSIDYNIKKAIKHNINPITAITIATLNAAKCYNLKNKGAVAAGYDADIVILDDLNEIKINRVIRKGKLNFDIENNNSIEYKSSMNIDYISKDKFNVRCSKEYTEVIKAVKGSLITEKVKRKVILDNGYIKGVSGDDVLKIGVFERHKKTKKYSIGFIEGLSLKNCSIAQTISHDSHNIIVVGDNDSDMTLAVNRLIDIGGGIVVVSEGKVLEEISLPVAGLMTYENSEFVVEKLKRLYDCVKRYMKYKDMDIFLTLAFMALPVIPKLKITDRGLYDFEEGMFINQG